MYETILGATKPGLHNADFSAGTETESSAGAVVDAPVSRSLYPGTRKSLCWTIFKDVLIFIPIFIGAVVVVYFLPEIAVFYAGVMALSLAMTLTAGFLFWIAREKLNP